MEDHLLTAGDTTYEYTLDGFLAKKTQGTEVTLYDYSSRGELLGVSLPDGTAIEYLHDPLGRRIAKKVNGIVTEKYLWSGMTRLLAVYDGADSLLMRFLHADGRTPLAVEKGSTLYYLAYDPIGSLKAVADSSGNVVKRIDYDVFGNIIEDTDPLFDMPLGFAGGLQDRDTGLVRFGYRDYDPEIGRWTAKDPIGFAGGDTDLYGYCLNDPVNFADPLGKHPGILIGALAGAFTGFKAGFASGSIRTGLFAGFVGGLTGAVVSLALPSLGPQIAGAVAGSVAGFVGRGVGKKLSDPCASRRDIFIEGLKGIPAGLLGGAIGGAGVAGVTYLEAGAFAAESAGAMIAAPILWGGDMLIP